MKRNNSMLPALLDSRSEFITSFDKLFDRMMNDNFPSFTRDFGVDFFGKSSYPKVDVIDTKYSVEIHAEIPGLNREDVEIKVENGNVLTIRGENKNKETSSEGRTYLYKELKHSSFVRKFALGENLSPRDIEAKFSNGILEIVIPKIQKKEEDDIIEVKIQ